MDVSAILTLIGTLASGVSGAVEVFKALLSKYLPNLSDDTRKVVLLVFAALAGIVAAAVANFNIAALLGVSLDARLGIVLSGVALILPADLIRSALELVKMSRDHQEAKAFAVEQQAVNGIPLVTTLKQTTGAGVPPPTATTSPENAAQSVPDVERYTRH